jgi:CheY-like chemotaxis protein
LGVEEILEAENGLGAVEVLESGRPVDLIISDWNMPEMDGYELLVWVRENDDLGNVPFLMATGQSDKKQ